MNDPATAAMATVAGSPWSTLLGHELVRDQLRTAISANRLAHTFLFVGPRGIGKRLFAELFAMSLLCSRFDESELDACGACSSCLLVAQRAHPDVSIVACPEGRAEIPVALLIGDDDKRGREGLCHDLALKPMMGHRRIAIIDDANRLNEEGSNALLKTLEEPPDGAVLIVIAESVDAILPTIRSRCQRVRFDPLSTESISQLLLTTGQTDDPATAAAIAQLADGSMHRAIQLLNPELAKLRTEMHAAFTANVFSSVSWSSAAIAALEAAGETAEQRPLAGWLLQFTMRDLRAAAIVLAAAISRESAENPSSVTDDRPLSVDACAVDESAYVVANRFLKRHAEPTRALESVLELLQHCADADHQILANAPVKLVIETLAAEIAIALNNPPATRR